MIVTAAPYGSWESPILSHEVASHSLALQEMYSDGKNLYISESRPSEKGRVALIKNTSGNEWNELANDASVRTRVHEYGGGAFAVYDGQVYFTNDRDRYLYLLDRNGKWRALGGNEKERFADIAITNKGKTLFSVFEEHQANGQVLNSIVRIDIGNKIEMKKVATGHDFYSSPRVSPDGHQLAFITWDFPNMPWDGSSLWVASILSDGSLSTPKWLAGGKEESICQVQWSPEGILYFVSDRTGFWNLYRDFQGKIEPLYPMKAEFGQPAWVFGRPMYAFCGSKIVCVYTVKGIDYLGILSPTQKQFTPINLPFTVIQNVCECQGKVYFFGGSPTESLSVVSLDPQTKKYEIIKKTSDEDSDPAWISIPELIEYPSLGGKTGYAFYYPPKNPNYQGMNGEKPPLLVRCHGGPNARSTNHLQSQIQFWTSRGIGFLDVNYGGSSGYGREYLKRLEGQWGILDVEDARSAALTLAKKGYVDPNRLLIKGGSAGGYTVLKALTSCNTFAAGASYYGVSDLELLVKDTHKFEARYLDRLIGPYPEKRQLYLERSPIYHVDQLKRPVLLLQGKEDKVVPPNQTLEIYEAAKRKKIPVAMLLFDGEQHGFRLSSSIQQSLEAELSFYSQVLGFPISEEIPLLSINK